MFRPTRAIDLYGDVVLKATEWPIRDRSIKTLAQYLGFVWRDKYPSCAGSVEWFDRRCTHRTPELKQRILEYNEDDCRADARAAGRHQRSCGGLDQAIWASRREQSYFAAPAHSYRGGAPLRLP
ncbi:ribonuclease H-like domain-containing protein [Bradyrhizobium sp. 155]|nr:ribonuclease H-like domain-containing protein [Bradyrhizobium sp. 155]